MKDTQMRKFAVVVAAALAMAAPTVASAQRFSVRIGGDDGYRDRGDYREFRGARAEYRDHDRGWHRGWDRDRRWDRGDRRGERVTIIKRQRSWDD